MSSNIRCSIVIPLYNKVELTQDCVRALRRHTPNEMYELILVDNASGDGTEAYCESLEDVTVIRNEENRGFSGGCNQGADASSGEIVVFLNNDTEVHPGWLQALLAVFDEQDIGAAGSKLLYPDGRVQHAGVAMIRKSEYPYLAATHFPYRCSSDNMTSCLSRDVQVVTGACLAIRTELFEQLEKFDEAYWCGYEDVDLCLKVGAAGYRVRYVADSVVTHRESASGVERFRATTANEQLLHDRWSETCVVDLISERPDHLDINPNGALAGSGA